MMSDRTKKRGNAGCWRGSKTSRVWPAALLLIVGVGCKEEKTSTTGKPVEQAAAGKPAEKAAGAAAKPSTTPPPGQATVYTHADPGFSISVPSGFVANSLTQTGQGVSEMRLAKEGMHSATGAFVSISIWQDAKSYEPLLRQNAAPAGATEATQKDLANGQFVAFTRMSDRYVKGELTKAKEFVGKSVVKAGATVLTCEVATYDDPAAPEFINACQTLQVK